MSKGSSLPECSSSEIVTWKVLLPTYTLIMYFLSFAHSHIRKYNISIVATYWKVLTFQYISTLYLYYRYVKYFFMNYHESGRSLRFSIWKITLFKQRVQKRLGIWTGKPVDEHNQKRHMNIGCWHIFEE